MGIYLDKIVIQRDTHPNVCNSTTIHSSQDMKIGEDNGTPLQYSCLENPMDGEAW